MNLIDAPTTQTPAQLRAASAMRFPRATFTRAMRSFTDWHGQIWGAPVPADVLAAMGTKAAECLARLAALGAYLEGQMPGCTAKTAATAKPYTANTDGTVAIKV